MKAIIICALVLAALANEINGQSSTPTDKKICEPGTKTKVDCNTCTCSIDGTELACTRMACPKIPPEYLNPDGSIKLPHQRNPLLRGKRETEEKTQICEPGTKTKIDCNTCTCSIDGTELACTRMACPKIPPEYLNPDGSIKLPHQRNPLLRGKRSQTCTPFKSFMDRCNHCICSADGYTAACTMMECVDEPIPDRKYRSIRDASFRCTPNKSFKQDCNTCICSPDGHTAACTLMLCIDPSFLQQNPNPSIAT